MVTGDWFPRGTDTPSFGDPIRFTKGDAACADPSLPSDDEGIASGGMSAYPLLPLLLLFLLSLASSLPGVIEDVASVVADDGVVVTLSASVAVTTVGGVVPAPSFSLDLLRPRSSPLPMPLLLVVPP